MNIPDKYASQYNVHNFLKDKTPEEIKQYCQSKAAPVAMAMVNWEHDFNCAQLIRISNFFGFTEVFFVQKGRKWDKRGAVGSQHYIKLTILETEEEFIEIAKSKYSLVGIENNLSYSTLNIHGFVPKINSCFVFGSESIGLSEYILNNCESIVTIPAFGSIRSLNCASTSSIIASNYRMYYH